MSIFTILGLFGGSFLTAGYFPRISALLLLSALSGIAYWGILLISIIG